MTPTAAADHLISLDSDGLTVCIEHYIDESGQAVYDLYAPTEEMTDEFIALWKDPAFAKEVCLILLERDAGLVGIEPEGETIQ